MLSKFCDVHGIGFPWGPLLAAGAGTLMGLLAAIPALRIRGVNLAVATLAAAVVIEQFVYNLPVFASSYTAQSQATISPPSMLGASFGPLSKPGWDPDPVVFGVLRRGPRTRAGGRRRIRRSRLGRRMLAVRSNERAAAAAGVNVARTKLIAFAIAAFIAGIGGTLYGYLVGGVDVTTFSSIDSLLLIAVAYLGGIAAWEGAPIAGAIFQGGILATFLSNIAHVSAEYAVYIAGIGLIFASINNQEGISGTVREGLRALVEAAFRAGDARAGGDRGRVRHADMTLLEVEELAVSFGGSRAVDGVTLEVSEGQLVGLIGPNGAGKTTTIDAISGFVPSQGTVLFKGAPFQRARRGRSDLSRSPTQRARLGLSRTWQGADLFVDLSVMDNLRVAGERRRDEDLTSILSNLGIEGLAGSSVLSLSHGQRKLVGVARALAAAPALVCMDEPAAGLDTQESQLFGQRIRGVADEGTSVVLIDHDMGLVLGICDYIYVLDFGHVIAQGPPAEVRTNPAVLEAYLGSRHAKDAAATAPAVVAPAAARPEEGVTAQ